MQWNIQSYSWFLDCWLWIQANDAFLLGRPNRHPRSGQCGYCRTSVWIEYALRGTPNSNTWASDWTRVDAPLQNRSAWPRGAHLPAKQDRDIVLLPTQIALRNRGVPVPEGQKVVGNWTESEECLGAGVGNMSQIENDMRWLYHTDDTYTL